MEGVLEMAELSLKDHLASLGLKKNPRVFGLGPGHQYRKNIGLAD